MSNSPTHVFDWVLGIQPYKLMLKADTLDMLSRATHDDNVTNMLPGLSCTRRYDPSQIISAKVEETILHVEIARGGEVLGDFFATHWDHLYDTNVSILTDSEPMVLELTCSKCDIVRRIDKRALVSLGA